MLHNVFSLFFTEQGLLHEYKKYNNKKWEMQEKPYANLSQHLSYIYCQSIVSFVIFARKTQI